MDKKKYYKFFERKYRGEDNCIFVLTDEAPIDLVEFMKNLHDGKSLVPNDWLYAMAYEAFLDLHIDDIDHASVEPDPYHSQLISWLSNEFAADYCTEVMNSYGPFESFWDLVGYSQWIAKQAIYERVDQFIRS